MEYLGMITGQGIVHMDPIKLSAIKDWQTPSSIGGVCSFLGFANIYHEYLLFSSLKRTIPGHGVNPKKEPLTLYSLSSLQHLSFASLMSLTPFPSWMMPLFLLLAQFSCNPMPWVTSTLVLAFPNLFTCRTELWYLWLWTPHSDPCSHRMETIPAGYLSSCLHSYQPQELVLSERSTETLLLTSLLVSLSSGLWHCLESHPWHTNGTCKCSLLQGPHWYCYDSRPPYFFFPIFPSRLHTSHTLLFQWLYYASFSRLSRWSISPDLDPLFPLPFSGGHNSSPYCLL